MLWGPRPLRRAAAVSEQKGALSDGQNPMLSVRYLGATHIV